MLVQLGPIHAGGIIAGESIQTCGVHYNSVLNDKLEGAFRGQLFRLPSRERRPGNSSKIEMNPTGLHALNAFPAAIPTLATLLVEAEEIRNCTLSGWDLRPADLCPGNSGRPRKPH
jgi:hypothetical protein